MLQERNERIKCHGLVSKNQVDKQEIQLTGAYSTTGVDFRMTWKERSEDEFASFCEDLLVNVFDYDENKLDNPKYQQFNHLENKERLSYNEIRGPDSVDKLIEELFFKSKTQPILESSVGRKRKQCQSEMNFESKRSRVTPNIKWTKEEKALLLSAWEKNIVNIPKLTVISREFCKKQPGSRSVGAVGRFLVKQLGVGNNWLGYLDLVEAIKKKGKIEAHIKYVKSKWKN